MMNVYRVLNRGITNPANRWWEGAAANAQEACQKAGWLIEDCWVRERSYKGSGGWKKPDELKK